MTKEKLTDSQTSFVKKMPVSIMAFLKKYFNAMPDKEDEENTIKAISNGVSFHGANLWVLVFAIFTASLGLNVNSTAVIIGAMLISPLMGPIIGMGLAVGINDFELLKRSLKNYLVATIISVCTATLYFLLTPLDEAQSELLARTSPTLYDVLIALCGGAAGIVALATKGKGNVLPGVAIATALMPPLCTAGFGIATGNIFYFLGAFYLFFINTVFIALATYIGVRMLKFKEKQFVDHERQTTVKKYIIIIVVATMIPAGFMTYSIVKTSVFKSNLSKFVKEQLDSTGTRIISYEANNDSLTLRVVAVGKELSDSAIAKAEKEMQNYNIRQYKLEVIQGSESTSLMMLNNRLTNMRTSNDNYSDMVREETAKISELQKSLDQYTKYDIMAPAVAKEIKSLFDNVDDISLSNASYVNTDSLKVKHYTLAVIGVKAKANMKELERSKITDWLKARLQADSIKVVITKN